MERKRGKYPRLFFLSNEELIEIFGRGAGLVGSMLNGENQGFISNLFEGVDHVIFSDSKEQEITHITSKDGEQVLLVKDVPALGMTVDTWLGNLDASMINTVKDSLF